MCTKQTLLEREIFTTEGYANGELIPREVTTPGSLLRAVPILLDPKKKGNGTAAILVCRPLRHAKFVGTRLMHFNGTGAKTDQKFCRFYPAVYCSSHIAEAVNGPTLDAPVVTTDAVN